MEKCGPQHAGVDDSEMKEKLDLVSQKQAAGLDIHVDVTANSPVR